MAPLHFLSYSPALIWDYYNVSFPQLPYIILRSSKNQNQNRTELGTENCFIRLMYIFPNILNVELKLIAFGEVWRHFCLFVCQKDFWGVFCFFFVILLWLWGFFGFWFCSLCEPKGTISLMTFFLCGHN